MNRDIKIRCGDISWERYEALLATTPTSIAGCAALLRYIDQHEANYGVRGALLRIEAVASSPPTFAKLGYASGTFDVRYHETLDFFRITGALRCKANNFFGYDFN